MRCPKCQFENREGVKFCEECGAVLDLICPNCSTKIVLGRKFCGECGYKLTEPSQAHAIDYSHHQSYTPKFLADKILSSRSSLEGERKLVTVLFADVANYTSMAEKLDPEEVHLIMDGCFKILIDEIHNYEGTINQFTGDGVMALFGAPLAYEDHAERACYASLSIQIALKNYREKLKKDYGIDFKIRIGLNSGSVVVGSIGDDLRMDYTAIGDTTNVASRMESKAEPGSILVSEATHKLVKDFFDFKPVGKIDIKGKEQLQDAYELIKAGEIETRIRASILKGLTKFVGRKSSMSALKEAYKRVLSGSGQVVGIVGEAGVGKSRLLFEFINQLPRDEYQYFEGRCVHYGRDMSYLPITEILRTYFGIKHVDQELAIKNQLIEKILQLDQRLSSRLSAFQDFFSISVDDKKYLQVDPSVRKLRIFEAIRDLFIQESDQKPLVLAIEDLHWIDKNSEEFLSLLIDSLASTRIFLILLYRLEYTHQWGSKSYYTKVGLTQLGTVSSSQLVQAILLEGEVAPELRELIISRAGGNPFYVEEFTHNLLENALIERKDHQFVLTRGATKIHVPDAIQGIISARIDRLEENIKRVMQVASVIGREFTFRLLQKVMGMTEELKSHLRRLQGLELISEQRLFPEPQYMFKHALIQEVAYNSLLKKRREAIHDSIGQAIELLYIKRLEDYHEVLAYHYLRSKNAEKAIQYLDFANRKAIKANAVEQAKKYFDDAMGLLDMLPETPDYRRRRISLLVNQLLTMFLLFKYPEYYDLLTRFEQVAIGLKDDGLLGAFYARLGTCEWSFGNFDLALQKDTMATELCESAGDLDEAAYAYAQLQGCHFYLGNLNEVLLLKERVLHAMKGRFNLRNYLWTMFITALACAYLGRWKEAEVEGHQILRTAEEYSDDSVASFAAAGICLAYALKGDGVRAAEYGEWAVQKASTPLDKAMAESFLASAWCRTGETQKGIEVLAAQIQNQRDLRYFPVEISTVYLGEGYFRAGEYDKATQTMEEVLEISERHGMKWCNGIAHRLLGEISLRTDFSQAANHFQKSMAMFEEISAKNELALAYAGYGRLYRQRGNIVKAREYLTKALEILERLGTLVEPEKIKEELTGLPQN